MKRYIALMCLFSLFLVSSASADDPPGPVVQLEGLPASVPSGSNVLLRWVSSEATRCTASSSPEGIWSGEVAPTGSQDVVVTVPTNFFLKCWKEDNSNAGVGEIVITIDGAYPTPEPQPTPTPTPEPEPTPVPAPVEEIPVPLPPILEPPLDFVGPIDRCAIKPHRPVRIGALVIVAAVENKCFFRPAEIGTTACMLRYKRQSNIFGKPVGCHTERGYLTPYLRSVKHFTCKPTKAVWWYTTTGFGFVRATNGQTFSSPGARSLATPLKCFVPNLGI